MFCLLDPSREGNPIVFASEGASGNLSGHPHDLLLTLYLPRILLDDAIWLGPYGWAKLPVPSRAQTETLQR